MASKNNTQVIIDGKVYTLSGYESEEYLQKVANFINNKINSLKEMEGYQNLGNDMKKALLDFNLADDYFKAKKQADSLENEIDTKDKQLYDTKHEIIALQIKNEAAEKEISALKEQINDLEKQIVRLETKVSEKEKKTTTSKKSS